MAYISPMTGTMPKLLPQLDILDPDTDVVVLKIGGGVTFVSPMMVNFPDGGGGGGGGGAHAYAYIG